MSVALFPRPRRPRTGEDGARSSVRARTCVCARVRETDHPDSLLPLPRPSTSGSQTEVAARDDTLMCSLK